MSVQRSIVCIVFSLVLLCLFTLPAMAAKAGVRIAPDNQQLLLNYKIHYGTISQNYSYEIDLGAPEILDGTFTAVVDGLEEGQTYFFAATSYDGNNESTFSNELEYTVPVPLPPVAHDATVQGDEDTQITGILSADNPENSPVQFAIVSQPTNGLLSLDTNSGSYTYSPAANFHGSDTFSYNVSGSGGTSNTATVTLSIVNINDAPTASGSAFNVNENTAYSSQLTAEDIDGDALSFILISPPSLGTVTISQTGIFTYTPNTDTSGYDSFTFQVSDGLAASAPAEIAITINHINDAPTALNSSFSMDQDSTYQGQLTAYDENGDTLFFSLVSAPVRGSVVIAENGSFTYTPIAGEYGDDSFTFTTTDGYLGSNTATVNISINEAAQGFTYEIGEVDVSSEWLHISFVTEFTNPAVVAKTVTMNEADPHVVLIQNLTNTGFDIRIKEWDYLDGVHSIETVHYMALEQGGHIVNDNFQAAAECSTIADLEIFQQISYPLQFADEPVVLTSVITANDSDTVTTRIKDITINSFSISLQEQEDSDAIHSSETICYIALEQYNGITEDLMIEVAKTSNSLLDSPSTISFSQPFPEIPYTLAEMETANGMNTAVLGLSQLSSFDTQMAIIEEQSGDSEISHIAETGGYIALTPFIADQDPDQDGLSNEMELMLNTHPGLFDSDQDGLGDGEEYAFWQNAGVSSDTDTDGDGIKNLLDNDSDNDGFSDGVEVVKGFDPADPLSCPSTLIMEVGEVEAGSIPTRVNLLNQYSQPVIIANSTTANDQSPFVIRISNVDSQGFSVQLQEYDYQDNVHGSETISYLVIEQGIYSLGDGIEIEAGKFSTNAASFYYQQSLAAQFTTAPVILTSIVSVNDTEAVVGRVRAITTGNFEYKLQEQEANSKVHGVETIAYLAWSSGSGTVGGIHFQAGVTSDSVTHNTYTINLTEQFSDLPFHFGAMQTTDGGDTSSLKIVETGIDFMEVRVEEESSRDTETKHTKEVAGFLVILPQ